MSQINNIDDPESDTDSNSSNDSLQKVCDIIESNNSVFEEESTQSTSCSSLSDVFDGRSDSNYQLIPSGETESVIAENSSLKDVFDNISDSSDSCDWTEETQTRLNQIKNKPENSSKAENVTRAENHMEINRCNKPTNTNQPHSCRFCYEAKNQVVIIHRHLAQEHKLSNQKTKEWINKIIDKPILSSVAELRRKLRKDPPKNISKPKKKTTAPTTYLAKRNAENNYVFECIVCGRDYCNIISVLRHQSMHYHDLKYVCDLCNDGFWHQTLLNEHKRIHNRIQTYSFKCEICKHKMKASYSYQTHKENFHTFGPWKYVQCKTCGKKIRSEHYLREHQSSCGKTFPCTQCNRELKTQKSLKLHKMSHAGK